jgi:LuxR family transcriptional regulator, maltose regulon positive regulatory protein
MVIPHSAPAKLSRPRLFDISPRERLFERLDACRMHPAVWIEGPAGAGKTSLIAGYVEARRVPTWWYQVDSSDADIANLFFYLRQLPGWPIVTDSLPPFAPEYQTDVPAFARRFFRTLFSDLTQPTLLVLDNVQDAIGNATFAIVLRELVEQLPESVNVLLVSRWEPPAVFARLMALRAVVRIGWPELQLTAEETAAIAGVDPGCDAARIAELRAACGGWAAGLTLMLARHNSSENLLADSELSREATFDFLASEILDNSSPEVRSFLLATWVLPTMTVSLATQLTENGEADHILTDLFQQNYFIERHGGPEPRYRYHALFREFLAARARRLSSAEQISGLQRRAAKLLEVCGEYAEAFALFKAVGSADECKRLILSHGEALVRSGRLQTLRSWIDLLPPEVREAMPVIGYWRGSCDLGTRPADARRFFVEAAAGFAAAGDEFGRVRSIAGVIDTWYAEWSDFSALDPWVSQLVALLDRSISFPSVADELQSVAAALVAVLYRQPAHPHLPDLAARAHRLLDESIEPDVLVAAGTYLLNCYNWMGQTGLAQQVIARVSTQVEAAGVSTLHRTWWYARLAYHHYVVGESPATVSALETATAMAHEHGFVVAENVVLLYSAFQHLSDGEADAARPLLARFEQRLSPKRHLDCAIASYQRAWIALLEGKLELALDFGGKAVALAQRAGVPNVEGYFTLLVAFATASTGDVKSGLTLWHRGYHTTDPERFPLFEFTAQLVRAAIAQLARDADDCRRALTCALSIGARHDYANNLFWLADTIACLCARAMEWDIEPDYVRRLIRRRALLAPAGLATDRWPWPLRIYTLGAFRVERRGETVRFSRKAQKRPLLLLMAMVALGARDVSASLLAETLWPDADGDAARAALGTTLYRLRHLLETDNSIVLNDGKLSLDPRLVWVDCQAFERLAEEFIDDRGTATTESLFHLYQGHFLDREEEQPWMIASRTRLQGLFVRVVEMLGISHEQAGCWDRAALTYERGIALDMLAEPLYRRLMICQVRQDRTAQALETYRRLRQALSIVLGIAPSVETESLRRSLG